jgi:Na+/H+ antiporter NhaD/arsenite permease-like protein
MIGFISIATFAAVLVIIIFDLLDIAVAGLLGVCVLLLFNALSGQEIIRAMRSGGESLALLFGGMVVARVLTPTGIFDLAEYYFGRAVKGSGKRFLIGMVALIAPVCAFLPNATTVILTAPIFIRTANALEVEFVTPVVLCALIGNTSGILTLVGDPATFTAGSAIGLSFNDYLKYASLGGVVAMLAIVPMLPLVARDTWNTQRAVQERRQRPKLQHPLQLGLSLFVLALMIFLFLFGDALPGHLVPPAAAILCGSLALLLENSTKFEPIDKVLGDIDWTTLIFLGTIFCLIEALTKTGIFGICANLLYSGFGTNLPVVALVTMLGTFAASTLIANIPLILAMTLVVKSYFVVSGLMPETALSNAFGPWPLWTLPVFLAMTFGTTLGGGATMVGDSANIVACGICARAGRRVTFMRFLKIGLPISLAQLAAALIYNAVLVRIL